MYHHYSMMIHECMCLYQICIKFDPLPTSDIALLQVGNYTGDRTIHREAKISNAFGVSEKSFQKHIGL